MHFAGGVPEQGGVPARGEVYLPGGNLLGGVCPGCVYPSMQWGRHTLYGQTDTCKNITFETSFAGGNKFNQKSYLQWGQNWRRPPFESDALLSELTRQLLVDRYLV